MIYGAILGMMTLASSTWATAESCATRLPELQKNERLQSVQELFKDSLWVGLVNETGGSYIVLEAHGDKLEMSFFTSGLFDLYPVKRSGEIKICDSGGSLTVYGMGRVDQIKVTHDLLIVNDGGPKMTFHRGNMPLKLSQLHHMETRGIASEPPGN